MWGSNPLQAPVIDAWDDPDEWEHKQEFARELVRDPTNPFICASRVFPGSALIGRALHVAQNWPTDPDVQEMMRRIAKEGGPAAYIPTREEIARKILTIAEDITKNVDDRLKAFRLFGEYVGHIEKVGKGVNVNTTNNIDVSTKITKVMAFADYGSDDEWEKALKEQQTRLIEDAKS